MSTERFDKAASEWDTKPRRVQVAEKISAAIGRLPLSQEMDAMEYGCGTGLVGLPLASAVGRLTAIDTSRGMLDVVQEKINDLGLKNVHPLCCDLLAEEYAGKHDLIFCSMTLHHIKDTTGLLRRFTELLNPGGYLALADLVTEDGSFHDPSAEGIRHHGFNPETLKDLLIDLNMGDLTSEIIHTIVKEEQNNREYPVFLLSGRKAG
ncbi:MAG: class I SAM-dependent methyltransferase [Desulfocapsa sp.]|nr:class I SAM-dependent methyltransferase [Desulfocapsa sp.]